MALLAVAAYIGMATVGHVNPPVMPVEGVSMRPTLQAGDLVFLRGVDPKRLHKGEIVAVQVPSDARKKYNLPAHILHRIVKVGHDQDGLVFTTKGDANAGDDVFGTHASDVIGEMRFHVAGAGYPFLFFRSRQGEIFAAAAIAVALLYFALGLFEDRRISVEGTAATMQVVLEQTEQLRRAIEHGGAGGSEAFQRAGPPAGWAPAFTPRGHPVTEVPEADDLARAVREANARSHESAETMRELVGAIGEYGEHLRSHTQVMINLAETTGELRQAVSEMRGAVREASPPALIPAPQLAAAATEPLAASARPFQRAFRGYAPGTVSTVVADLTSRLGTAEQRIADLEAHNAALAADRERLERDLGRYREQERALTQTLADAEERARAIRREAEHEAALLLARARAEADQTVQAAGERLRVLGEVEQIRLQLRNALAALSPSDS